MSQLEPEAVKSCSMCQRSEGDVLVLIEGPGVRICNHCVGGNLYALAHHRNSGTAGEDDGSKAAIYCSFCGDSLAEAKRLAGDGPVRICARCLVTAFRLVDEHNAMPPPAPPLPLPPSDTKAL